MALTAKKVSNFFGASGSPASDTEWDKLEWNFDARNVKIIVEQGSTAAPELSMDGKDPFVTLPAPETNQNALVYDLDECNLSRLWLRETGAKVQVMAYGVY